MRPFRHDASLPWRDPRASLGGGASTMLMLCLLAPARAGSANEYSRNLFRVLPTPAASGLQTTPHPAVVRIVVAESRALSHGSGAYVAARDSYGLVVTNWHVVRDAADKIEVVFPSGFRSAATILKSDRDWDLAALLIWRPHVTPLTISQLAPQPGDMLTIAGYGPGDYRAISGKCIQYVAPSAHHPYEIVELSAQARQGDSGGPILNDRGELAGVLFGASRGSTSGSYCGRVRQFLNSAWPDLEQRQPATTVATPLVGFDPPPESRAPEPPPASPLEPASPQYASAPTPPRAAEFAPADDSLDVRPAVVSTPPPPLAPASTNSLTWEDIAGTTRFDQAKTILAAIGLLTLWGHLVRRKGR